MSAIAHFYSTRKNQKKIEGKNLARVLERFFGLGRKEEEKGNSCLSIFVALFMTARH